MMIFLASLLSAFCRNFVESTGSNPKSETFTVEAHTDPAAMINVAHNREHNTDLTDLFIFCSL
jgi:hypothetical protein